MCVQIFSQSKSEKRTPIQVLPLSIGINNECDELTIFGHLKVPIVYGLYMYWPTSTCYILFAGFTRITKISVLIKFRGFHNTPMCNSHPTVLQVLLGSIHVLSRPLFSTIYKLF